MDNTLTELKNKLKDTQRALTESETRGTLQHKELNTALKEMSEMHKNIEFAKNEWEHALDGVGDLIFLHDKNFYILRCNLAYQKYAGMPFSEIIGKPYFDVFPKMGAPLAHCTNEMKTLDREGERNEIQVDDTVFDSHSYALTDESGDYLYSVHMLKDITEQRKNEEKLKESEKQYRRLFEEDEDGIIILDAETGRITDVNPSMLNLLSCQLNECTERNLLEICLFADIEIGKSIFNALRDKVNSRYENLLLNVNDDRQIHVEFTSSHYIVSEKAMVQCHIKDISEQINIQNKLSDSEEKFLSITTAAQDAIVMMDDAGKITYWNDAAKRIFGYTRKETIGQNLHALLTPERFLEAHHTGFEHFRKTGEGSAIGKTLELSALRKDGTEFPIELSLSAIMREDKWNSVGIVRDISQRKKDEAGLKMFRALLDHSSDMIEVADAETLQYLDVNETTCRTHGYTRDEFLSINVRDIDVAISDSKLKKLIEVLKTKSSTIFESTHRRKDGSFFPAEISISLVQTDKEYLVAIVRDITERKHTEEQIQQLTKIYATLSLCNHAITHSDNSQDLFEKICEHSVQAGGMMMAWIGLVDPKTNIVHAVASYGDENHYLDGIEISTLATEPSGRGPASTAIREDRPVWCQDFINDVSTVPWHESAKIAGWGAAAALPIHQNGEVIGAFILYSSQLNVFDTMIQKLITEMAVDISFALNTFKQKEEREESESNLLKTKKLLDQMSAVALVGGWEFDPRSGEGSWTAEVARIHDMDPNNLTTIKIGLSVYEGEWLKKIEIAIDKAINKKQPYDLILQMTTPKGVRKWVRTIGTPVIEQGEVVLIHGSIQDITMLKTSENALHESLIGTIQAMASTVEMRDSYTAGHQKRVASLSYAIAEMMGLDSNRMEGLQLAAQIHDLGKIHIPAEILSKPGKLSNIEFMLIQTHSQAGYDILKDVKFPWPIADIILQHHEKLDGSGYPQGLKGDQILLESKIITVADVVEAMSSHRPYRAGLGIEVALDEIKRGSGSLYDSSVVDACLKLFTDKKFAFSGQDS